jgi:hypothetical protein
LTELVPLQQWFQGVVTHLGSVHEVSREVDDHILPSHTLAPVQRIGIYHGMYLLRMVEALEADYPALAHYLGHGRFHRLAADYVQAHPSRTYTLNRLGDHLPELIEHSRLRGKQFLSDLARLELAMTEVFDEQELAPMSADAVSSVPPEALESMRLTPIRALRLLELRWDADAAFQAFRNEEPMRPVRGRTFVVVHRRDYSVMRMRIGAEAFVFLRELLDDKTLAEALETFVAVFGRGPGQQELFSWFRDWSAAGIFHAVAW